MQEDQIAEMIYDELISSICLDMASGIHRRAKTGSIKLSDIVIPRKDMKNCIPNKTPAYDSGGIGGYSNSYSNSSGNSRKRARLSESASTSTSASYSLPKSSCNENNEMFHKLEKEDKDGKVKQKDHSSTDDNDDDKDDKNKKDTRKLLPFDAVNPKEDSNDEQLAHSNLNSKSMINSTSKEAGGSTQVKTNRSNNGSNNNSKNTSNSSSVKQSKSNHNFDIWNRIPPKDVTSVCTNCNKVVGVSRFAMHLDKCMRIGNVRKSSM